MDRRDAAILPPGQPRAGDVPGPAPRQEYLDAFDEQHHGGRIPHQRRTVMAESPPARRRHVRTTEPRPPRPPGDSRGRRRHAGGGRGRLLTGVAAAAVVTVVVVVVPLRLLGQDTGERDVADAVPFIEPSGQPGGGTAHDRGPSRAPEPSARERSKEPRPSYDELMRATFELDPQLTGSGELVTVGGSDPPADPEARSLLRYRVDVEAGLGLDAEFFAEAVHRTLGDQRGWGNNGERGFARVSAGDHDFVITLASPGTTADWCARSGLDITEDNVSCNSSNTERVMINAWRWGQGAETYGDDIAGYRQMLINHEVGHRLDYGHVTCPAEGALAPVMMQQTKFLETGGVTCRPNPWPHPRD